MKAIEAFPISEEEARDLDELKKTFPDKSELRAVLEDYFHIYDDNASMEPQKFDMYFADFINDENERLNPYHTPGGPMGAITNSRKLIKSAFKKGDKFENAYGATIVIDDPDANGRIQYVVRAGNSADCKSVDSDEKMQKILDDNGYIESSFKSFCENKNMGSKECKKFLAWIRKNREDVDMNNNLSDDVLKKYYIQYLKTISNSVIKSAKEFSQHLSNMYNQTIQSLLNDLENGKITEDQFRSQMSDLNNNIITSLNGFDEEFDSNEDRESNSLQKRIAKMYDTGALKDDISQIPADSSESNPDEESKYRAAEFSSVKRKSIKSALDPTEAQTFKETLIRAGYTEEQAQEILDQANQVKETQGEMMTSGCHGKQKKENKTDTKNRSISSAKNISIKSIKKK